MTVKTDDLLDALRDDGCGVETDTIIRQIEQLTVERDELQHKLTNSETHTGIVQHTANCEMDRLTAERDDARRDCGLLREALRDIIANTAVYGEHAGERAAEALEASD